ncbi:concanavalin A-like lectin/glucanase domain-containing protein [Gymnopilus junonius]|uniref:Concanavalin A-like lectin/glucanase domain-containing protein n=1 Tax=Gymnopilus junonius TaxID=109634 RepID=A0A9P5P248_GYMJU|nr:concanavalin A-like lectin/glucanase domain-containing protein [Gymnopilus junonius]
MRKIEAPTSQASRSQSYMSSVSLHSDDEERLELLLRRVDQVFKLPTRWSEQDRHQSLSVSSDGRELSYHGPSNNSDKDAAAARTNNPVEILGKEQKRQFAGKSVKFGRLPGWEPNSWGYHGGDGHSLAADKAGSQYGPTFGAGDIVGSFYTRNGTLIGSVFDNVGKSGELYPSVGLQRTGDVVRTNFGQSPFKFDIDYHILSTPLDHTLLRGYPRRTGAGSIASITNDIGIKPTASEEETKNLLNHLVLSYLVHHGYARTARALESQKSDHRASDSNPDIEMSRSDAVENDIESRTRIVNSVLVGDMDTAIEALRSNYPSVFVELILETAEIKKKLKSLQADEQQHIVEDGLDVSTEEEMDIDIDQDIPVSPTPPTMIGNGFGHSIRVHSEASTSAEDIASQYESALNVAIVYGQTLSNDYQSDPRPEVQQLFKQTFGIVAWEDPLEVGGPIAELAGREARVTLAHEINQAILKSQGRPAQPALETLYRHTGACINQLGLLGVGAAAFADISREFL